MTTIQSSLSIIAACLVSFASCVFAEPSRLVKIGATLPLTGNLAHIGVDIRRGMEMAMQEVQGPAINFQVVYEDNQHTQKLAVSSAHKLLESDKVDVLVSLWDMADVVAPLAERKQIPHLSIRWNPHVAEENKFTVTFESTYLTYAAAQVELLKAWNAKSIALVTEENQGWVLSANALKERAPKNGIKVVADQSFLAGTAEFSTLVTRVLASKPDVIVINAHQPNLDLVLRRIQEQNPDQAITGYFEAVEPASLVEGLPFVAQFEVEPWFTEKFRAKYGEDFKVRAPHGYDMVKLIAHSYKQAGTSASGVEIVNALSKIKDFKGASGVLSTNATKNIENPCVWKIVRKGKFESLSPEILASLSSFKERA